MSYGQNLFEDLLKEDKFDKVNDLLSEVVSESTKRTNADGSSEEIIRKNPNGAPSVRAKKQGFSDAAVAKIETNKETSTNATEAGKPVGRAEASRNYANTEMDKYKNDQKLFDAGLIKEAPVDPSSVDTVAGTERELAYGATSPRGEAFAKAKAENKLSDFEDILTKGVESGSISPEDAEKARLGAQSEFDAAGDLGGGSVSDTTTKIAPGGTPFDNPLKEKGMTAPEIMAKEAADKKLITDSPKATKMVDKMTDELDAGKDPETLFGEIKSFFKDNPVMGQAILGALAGYISTGSLWKGAAAGLQGFAGGMQTEAAQEAATAAATTKFNKERRVEVAGYVKDGYTKESAEAFMKTGNAESLVFSNRKLSDDLAKIAYREGLVNLKADTKAKKEAGVNFLKISDATTTRLGKHWTDEERENYNIPDMANQVRIGTMHWLEKMDIPYDEYNNDAELQTQVGASLDTWNEFNRAQVNAGKQPNTNPLPFIEADIQRQWALGSGLPLDVFTSADGKVNGEQMQIARKMASSRARGDTTNSDVNSADIFSAWHDEFAKENDDELKKQAALAGMSPFLFWIEINA